MSGERSYGQAADAMVGWGDALYDGDQRIRAMLVHGEVAGVAGLSILGPDGRNGVQLLVSSEGDPSFNITDQRGLRVA